MLAAVLFFHMPASAISGEKALVMDEIGSKVIYSKNCDRRSLIASTTKIMTGLLICENCNVLDPVKIPREAVGVEGSSMYLKEGEVLTVQELLYGLMLRSGNDAAVALAIHDAGSVEKFARKMNEKAAQLGMVNSHFENPNGLDSENHYSTARDLGILGLAAMKNPIFRRTVSTRQVKAGTRYLKNHNKMLWQYPGADGIKTGYTRAAGRILVSSAVRHGRRLVAVTIHAPDDWNDHRILLDQGFERCDEKLLIRKNEKVGEIPILSGTGSSAPILADRDFAFWAAEGEKAAVIYPGPGFAYAPVVKGSNAGEALVLLDGTVVGKIPVSWGATLEQAEPQP